MVDKYTNDITNNINSPSNYDDDTFELRKSIKIVKNIQSKTGLLSTAQFRFVRAVDVNAGASAHSQLSFIQHKS